MVHEYTISKHSSLYQRTDDDASAGVACEAAKGVRLRHFEAFFEFYHVENADWQHLVYAARKREWNSSSARDKSDW